MGAAALSQAGEEGGTKMWPGHVGSSRINVLPALGCRLDELYVLGVITITKYLRPRQLKFNNRLTALAEAGGDKNFWIKREVGRGRMTREL